MSSKSSREKNNPFVQQGAIYQGCLFFFGLKKFQKSYLNKEFVKQNFAERYSYLKFLRSVAVAKIWAERNWLSFTILKCQFLEPDMSCSTMSIFYLVVKFIIY
jgi:hypothetical protein